ncbi:MAG: hypothetical protein L0H12_04885 [Nitrosospira sp.]|nr:hypothetical protein [Nitrosospira sp.]
MLTGNTDSRQGWCNESPRQCFSGNSIQKFVAADTTSRPVNQQRVRMQAASRVEFELRLSLIRLLQKRELLELKRQIFPLRARPQASP